MKNKAKSKSQWPKDLLGVSDLSKDQTLVLLEKSVNLAKKGTLKSLKNSKISPSPVALVFLEPSTRTRASFECAAHDLGRKVVLFEGSKGSSLEKGETLEDMFLNLRAYGIETVVARVSVRGDLNFAKIHKNLHVINAGDGTGEHPTQALLDAATLVASLKRESKKSLIGKTLLIMGDLAHSRVARSWFQLAPVLGLNLCFSSPQSLKPTDWKGAFDWTSDPSTFLSQADFVMALRIQTERIVGLGPQLAKEIQATFRLDSSKLSKNQLLLHPGPVNWGVELDSDLRNDPRSLILDQARMGRFLRAVCLSLF